MAKLLFKVCFSTHGWCARLTTECSQSGFKSGWDSLEPANAAVFPAVACLHPKKSDNQRSMYMQHVLEEDSLLSQCLTPPRCINGYQWI